MVKQRGWLVAAAAAACAVLLVAGFARIAPGASGPRDQMRAASPVPAWRKVVIDPAFRSEGAAVADVNRDGKKDVIVGDYWYQGPAWTRHEIRPPAGDLGNGANTYSKSFAVFADDFNRDGWTDVLVIGFPGQPCHWYENPKRRTFGGAASHWKERLVASSACNETPVFADLFGEGRPRLVMGTQPDGRMCWFEPDAKNIDAPWIAHPISAPAPNGAKTPGTQPFSHGLGVGDMNGDGRNDVLVREGWWEQPRGAKKNAASTFWTFHAADLGEDCADMFALDLNGDKRSDVVSSSAHRKGVWWHEQPPAMSSANGTWRHHLITDAFSQTHSLRLVDINGDGRRDLVTGKRWWAHGPTGDVDPNAPPVLVWIDVAPGRPFTANGRNGSAPTFTVHPIDDASGVGTQFSVEDVNGDGRPDIIVANKRGVFLFEQQRPVRRANR